MKTITLSFLLMCGTLAAQTDTLPKISHCQAMAADALEQQQELTASIRQCIRQTEVSDLSCSISLLVMAEVNCTGAVGNWQVQVPHSQQDQELAKCEALFMQRLVKQLKQLQQVKLHTDVMSSRIKVLLHDGLLKVN